jgi:three-Cys-motif partner protein
MAKQDFRLFTPDDLVDTDAMAAAAQGARAPDGRPQRELDSADMFISAEDGLLVRGVLPHSAEKSQMVVRNLATVTKAMGGKWFAKKHGLEYVELFSGPGRLLNKRTGIEQPGSPMEALSIPRPFHRCVFSDFASECARALEQRVGRRESVRVLCGDANDHGHLRSVSTLLNEKALVIAYLDPARPQDLSWSTVELIASEFGFVDLIINCPVVSLVRAIQGAAQSARGGPGVAGRFLDHPQPMDLLTFAPSGKVDMRRSIAAIRKHYDSRLTSLGFQPPARRTVHFPASNPYYDVLIASRHPTGVELWNNKTNPVKEDPQMTLLDPPE